MTSFNFVLVFMERLGDLAQMLFLWSDWGGLAQFRSNFYGTT